MIKLDAMSILADKVNKVEIWLKMMNAKAPIIIYISPDFIHEIFRSQRLLYDESFSGFKFMGYPVYSRRNLENQDIIIYVQPEV
jgi:hypothetical protein